MSLVDWLLLGMVGIMGILSESSNSLFCFWGQRVFAFKGLFAFVLGSWGGSLNIHSPMPLPTGIVSSAAHRSRCFRHRAASSLVTVRIHLVFGSEGSSLSRAGLLMNAEMLPQQRIIRFLVMGLFRAFSNLVSQRRFSALLLHLLVSLWSTIIVLLSGGP